MRNLPDFSILGARNRQILTFGDVDSGLGPPKPEPANPLDFGGRHATCGTLGCAPTPSLVGYTIEHKTLPEKELARGLWHP